jgi:retron-type reverse transcriptase
MKRVSISLEDIATFDNLARAAHQAARAKRERPDIQRFFQHFDTHINQLAQDIRDARMPYGRFRQFTIRDPKPRVIHAACFEDRIFHHAVMHEAGPVLEQALTPTTFACRKGMGNHAAVLQAQRYLRRFPWCVKIDIQHYFDSIDHNRLYNLLQRRFKGADFLALLRRVIDCFHVTPGKGLPIGALTSQHFANYYLDGLDRYILEHLGCCSHIRYMDDIIWWCHSRTQARQTLAQVCDYASRECLLTVKPTMQINQSEQGVSFCGYRMTPGQLKLSRRRCRRYQQLRQDWEVAYTQGRIDALTLQRAYDAVHAITLPGDSRHWRRQNLQRYPALDI